jgi:hypothetical protein
MRRARRLLASIALLLAAFPAAAQSRDGEWVAYRDAYRAMVRFEKYGGPKNLLVSRLQVRSAGRGVAGDGLQLTLTGKTTQLNLPLDALGRTVLPLQKSSYDENAVLALSRKGVPFSLLARVTIAPRPDGQYDGADLRGACGQALGFARWLDASQSARQCAGVRFVFAKKEQAGVRLRRADGQEGVLPAAAGAAFPGDPDDGFPVVDWRFGAQQGQLTTYDAPLAIVPLFE